MKIVNERDVKYTAFSNMEAGTVFIDEDDNILMKIKEGNKAKAVNLATGRVFELYDEFEGIVAEATLTIK